jgi:ATP-dependent DNA helicase RecG
MGEDRPYAVPEDITVKKNKKYQYYIRSNSSSIEAKGSDLDDLRDLAKKVPFDDRGNSEISIADISPTLVWEHLSKAGSRLTKEFNPSALQDTLEKMNLLTGPTERRLVKNVAVMMFCGQPDKFFPRTQVDIVIFPEGRIGNPNNLIEVPAIKGPVPSMIKSALEYLRTNVIKERIIKPKDREESVRYFNYPYQALEESVVNAMYHRDYQVHHEVEITIEPDGIRILSLSGPDRSISNEALQECRCLYSRRYKNNRLGDFLKELDLTEGRCTGIPTIQEELAKNGSPRAFIETDEDRSYFLMYIPVHEGCGNVVTLKEQKEDLHKDYPKITQRLPKARWS